MARHPPNLLVSPACFKSCRLSITLTVNSKPHVGSQGFSRDPALPSKHESWQNSSVMGCTTWREGGSYLLRNISSVYPCTSKGLDVPWESLALAESQQVCWERSAGADSQTRNTQTSPPHTHTSHLMHACAHIPPTPDSHLIKFLISFSAHVFTIFLGLPLQ